MIENGRFTAVDDLLDDGVLVAIRINIHNLTIAASGKGSFIIVSGSDSRFLWLFETNNKEEKDDN